MPGGQRTVVINRAPEAVFAFFSEHENDPKWRPIVTKIRPEGPPAVGVRVHQVISGPGGRRIPADFEITAHQPGQLHAFDVVAGPIRPHGEYRFAPTPDGGTEVTLALTAEIGGLKKLLMAKPVQKSIDAELAGLDRAKAVLEADDPHRVGRMDV
jgi:uncharacterized membrane protein